MPLLPILGGLFRLRSSRFHKIQHKIMQSTNFNTPWKQFVDKFQVKDLLPPNQQIYYCKNNESLSDVLKLMIRHQVTSVPVKNVEDRVMDKMISILDIMSVVSLMDASKGHFEVNHDTHARDSIVGEMEWKKFAEKQQLVFSHHNIEGIPNLSEREPWCDVYDGFPLHSLMDMFSKEVNLHHVVVTNDKGDIVGFISQSRVIEFFAENIDNFPETANKTIGECLKSIADGGDINRPVVCCHIRNDTVMSAFQKMISEKVSGLAVVDDNGKLVGSFSASDIKRCDEFSFVNDLYMPVGQFLARPPLVPNKQINSLSPIACDLDDSLASVIHTLHENKVHRIFMVDEENRPSKVLSLCDIITFINM